MKLYKIKKSKIDNKRGLYATKDIKEGTKIINYIGRIITNRMVEESAKFDNNKPIYLFTLNNKYTLDGDFHWNTAGLINHSCNNNCDYEGKGFKVWVSAITDIKKGDRPPWYFVPEKYQKDTRLNYKNYHLPHGAGVCKVTWPEGKLNFEWS